MSEATSSSPAAKRARDAESHVSSALATEVYRVRVRLPLGGAGFGTRVFGVHDHATFTQLDNAISGCFDRDPSACMHV